MSKKLLLTTELTASRTPERSPVRNQTRSRRLIFLCILLILGIGVSGYVNGLPRLREYRYRQLSLESLGGICSRGEDLKVCTLLTERAIRVRSSEKAIPALQACWERVRSGSVHASVAEKAELVGNLSLALTLAARAEEAQPLFSSAIQMNYNCVPAHLAAAFWLVGQEDDGRALHELQIVTTLDPKNYLGWFLLAHVYNQNNMLKKGREAAQKAIALNPDFPSSWQELGDSYGYAGNHEESLKAYQQELKLDPESMTAQSDVARALALTAKRPEQYRDAVARIESLLKRNVMNPGAAYSLLGDLHLRFGHYQEARKALEYSLKEDATIPDIYYKLAQARRLAGDSAGAAQATSQYKEMSYHYQRTRTLQKQASEAPDNADLHLKLAREWEYYKAWPQVEQAYREVLRIRPADPEATQGLSKLRRMAEQGKAVTPYNWVLERLLRQSQNAVQVQASEASGSTPPSPSGLK